jgi:hypothetical protein
VRRRHVRYTAIARWSAAQGESTALSARGPGATPDKPPLASGDRVRWRDRIGVFHRDLDDHEHAEIFIAERTYRVRVGSLPETWPLTPRCQRPGFTVVMRRAELAPFALKSAVPESETPLACLGDGLDGHRFRSFVISAGLLTC